MKFTPVPYPDLQVEIEEDTTLIRQASAAVRDSDSPPDPLIGTVLESRFEILGRLGSGGMSTVYLARNISFGGEVAIKFIRPRMAGTRDVMTRCILEAKSLASIPSNFVVRAHDVRTTSDGHIYIVMEYLEGEDLNALLKREGPLRWRRAAGMVRMICAGLMAAHRCQLIHRDIKPQNCFRVTLDDNPDHIKLIDFGIAKDVGAGLENTQTGTVLGTPEYMAPELVTGHEPDARSDIYAVGVTLYKLLTGVVPFQGKTQLETCQLHTLEPVIPPRARAPELGLPPEADLIVLKAMAKNPAHRYPSAQAMIADIEAALSRSRTGPLPVIRYQGYEDFGGSDDRPEPPLVPEAANEPSSALSGNRKKRVTHLYSSPAVALRPSVQLARLNTNAQHAPALAPATAPDPSARTVRPAELALKLGLPLLSILSFAFASAWVAPERREPVASERSHIQVPHSPEQPEEGGRPPEQEPDPPLPALLSRPSAGTPGSSAVPDPSPAPIAAEPPPVNPPAPAPLDLQPSAAPTAVPAKFYEDARKLLRDESAYFRKECLEPFFARNRGIFRISVGKSGTVRTIKITGLTNPNKLSEICITRHIGRIVFPRSPAGATFRYHHPTGAIFPVAPKEAP